MAPVATVENHSVQRNEWARMDGWIFYSDGNGQAATKYQFWDGNGAANSGYFWTPANAHHDVGMAIEVAAADLSTVWVRGGTAGAMETMYVRAFDGEAWGAWDAFNLTTIPNSLPVATIDNRSLQINQWAQVNSWLIYTDGNGEAATKYQFWDGNAGATSGYFWTPGNEHHAAGMAIEVAAADLAGVWVRGGAAAGGETMYVRAFDGSDWSAWDSFNLATTV
jgi:hypothetical protein